MKRLERIILIVIGSLALAGLLAGVTALVSGARSGALRADPVTHQDLARENAMDPQAPRWDLWRADPTRSVMVFGKGVRTGAFDTEGAEVTVRGLVERAGGFSPDAEGGVSVMRKDGGPIVEVHAATRAELAGAGGDFPVKPGDVVYLR